MEVNHRKIQVASLFTSIQQVETEIRKEKETAEQHNRDKALSNLRKARFMKQMQNLTKKLKEQTILTHSYPMPKPTNATELTKKLLDDSPDEVLIPDINNDLEEELTKLRLYITPVTNTNSATNKGTLEQTPECKLSASPCSISNQQENTTIASTKKAPQEKKKSEVYNSPGDKNKHTEEVIHARQPTGDTSNEHPSSEDFSESGTAMKPLKLTHKDHIEAYPWAHNASRNFQQITPLVKLNEEFEYVNMKYRSLPKYLTSKQREQMRQLITLTEGAMQKIDENIGIKNQNKKTIFFCKVCDSTSAFQHNKRSKCLPPCQDTSWIFSLSMLFL